MANQKTQPHEFLTPAPRTRLQKTGDGLSALLNGAIILLLVVMGSWLYALMTGALMKYINS